MSGQIERINTCGNCIFSHREQPGPMLECRKDPPHPHPIVIIAQREGTPPQPQILDIISVWPHVQIDQFCGHHKTNAIVRASELPGRSALDLPLGAAVR